MCLGRQGRVQRNEVCRRQQLVDFFEQLDLQPASARGREVGIECEHTHAESDRTPAQFTADTTHADDAKCLVVELNAFEMLSLPHAAFQCRIRARDVSCDAE